MWKLLASVVVLAVGVAGFVPSVGATGRTADDVREDIAVAQANKDHVDLVLTELKDEKQGLEEKIPNLPQLIDDAQAELDKATDQWGIDHYSKAVFFYTYVAPTFWPNRVSVLTEEIGSYSALSLTLQLELERLNNELEAILNPPGPPFAEWLERHPDAEHKSQNRGDFDYLDDGSIHADELKTALHFAIRSVAGYQVSSIGGKAFAAATATPAPTNWVEAAYDAAHAQCVTEAGSSPTWAGKCQQAVLKTFTLCMSSDPTLGRGNNNCPTTGLIDYDN